MTRMALAMGVLLPVCGLAQWTLTKEQMTAYTAMNPYERFPDGRPKVPDGLLEKVKGLVIEEAWGAVRQGCRVVPERYGADWRHPHRSLGMRR